MKFLTITIIIINLLFCNQCYTQAIQIGSMEDDWINNIELTGANEIIISGHNNNNCSFFSKTLQSLEQNDPNTQNGKSQDIFVAKLDTSMNLKWVKQFGGFYYTGLKGLEVDNKGNIYVSARFALKFFIGTDSVLGNRLWDNVVLKLDKKGNFQWAKTIKSTNSINVKGFDLNNGNVYISGISEDTLIVENKVFNDPNQNAFLLKLRSDGTLSWVKTFINEDLELYDVAAYNEATYISGRIDSNEGYINNNKLFNTDTSSRSFIVKFKNDSAFDWKKVGYHNFGELESLAYDYKEKKLYCAGSFGDYLKFDDFQVNAKGNGTQQNPIDIDKVLFKLDRSGKISFYKTFGRKNKLDLNAFVDESNGRIFFRTELRNGLPLFGDTIQIETLTEGYFATLNSNGEVVNEIRTKGVEDISMTEIQDGAITSNGTLFITGNFAFKLGFKDTTFTTNGADDGFIWKINNFQNSTGNQSTTNAKRFSNVNVFPNPTSSNLNIHHNSIAQNIRIKILSSTGEFIDKYSLSCREKLSIALQSGIYFLEISNDKKTHLKKVVVY